MNALRTLHAQLVSRVNVILAFLTIVGLAQVAHSQPTYEELYSFVKEPIHPWAGLTEASDGFLYGTTQVLRAGWRRHGIQDGQEQRGLHRPARVRLFD